MQEVVNAEQLLLSKRGCNLQPLEGASLCIYKACFATPAGVHSKTIFRLALSNKRILTFLRFRRAVIVYRALLVAWQMFVELKECAHCARVAATLQSRR